MSALKSNILVISKSRPLHESVDADWAQSIEESYIKLDAGQYDVVAVSSETASSQDFHNHFQQLLKRNPWTQVVVVLNPQYNSKDMAILHQTLPVFRLVDLHDSKSLFEQYLIEGLEKAQSLKQDASLESLVSEQQSKLRLMYDDLEDRVEKRQNALLEARKKTFQAFARWEAIQQSLIAIQQSLSIGEMEEELLKALRAFTEISIVRLILKPQDDLFAQKAENLNQFSIARIPLLHWQDSIGSFFAVREKTKPFNREDTEFFHRVAEGVALAVDRLAKLDQSQFLKEQWQTTFNAVSDPVSIINSNYEIVQSNLAFQEKAKLRSEKTIGQKCYKLLFQREQPCDHCQLGQKFRIDIGKNKLTHFDVFSQELSVDDQLYVNMYHDVTEQLRMERKILENTRLAELGTIGSSIAHELNNPLGGILSYVQLIKMETEKTHPIYPDLEEMELGVKRCRDIVENLLGFTRSAASEDKSDFDLREVASRAAKIMELQTKTKGIEIRITPETSTGETFMFNGHMNMLAQAIRNILQFSIDSFEHMDMHQPALLEIRIQSAPQSPQNPLQNQYQIYIMDNGPGWKIKSSLSQSVAQQIIHEHGGSCEFSSENTAAVGAKNKSIHMAKIILPRPLPQNSTQKS